MDHSRSFNSCYDALEQKIKYDDYRKMTERLQDGKALAVTHLTLPIHISEGIRRESGGVDFSFNIN
jgi:hypothetical protein